MLRASLTAAVLIGLLAVELPAQTQQTGQDVSIAQTGVTLDLSQMRVAAARAVQAGQFDLALSIARAMLVAAPQDSYSHFIIAQAFLRNGQPAEARPAARLSYKLADTPVQKHEAARVAAMTAAEQERYFPAQIWMRRALQYAPDDRVKQRAIAEFRGVRRAARLGLDFGFSITPSSNVNGGSAEELNVVDGFPFVGVLSPDAQALSGTVLQTDLRLDYRLHRDAVSQTSLRGTAQVKRVELSAAARDKAPTARSDNYNATLTEFGLSHTRRLAKDGPVLRAGLFTGRAWFGGEIGYDYGRAELSTVVPLTARTALSLGHLVQEQWNDTGPYSDIRTTGWNSGLSHRLGNRDRMSLVYSDTSVAADNAQLTREVREVRLRYQRARPVGPMKVSVGLGASQALYPDYRVIFPVPGGRKDTTYTADLDLTLHTLDYAGFVPTLRVSAERGTSNVSRFDTEEVSISVGFASAF